MSKKRNDQKPAIRDKKLAGQPQNAGRRKFVLLGIGAAAGAGLVGGYSFGWFDSRPGTFQGARPVAQKNLAPTELASNYQNALRATNEMLEYYARDIGNASVLIHAVRGFGKRFTLADGTNAVAHLCSRYAAEREINGKRYVFFKREAEVHENSFLKTFLEAGVGMDQSITAGGTEYNLRDLADSAKALFRCDPKDVYRFDDNSYRYDTTPQPPRRGPDGERLDTRGELIHEHLPWGLIAFSTLMPPDKASWTNAFGESIRLSSIADRALREYESTCSLGERELAEGGPAPDEFRKEIKKYSCFGLHSVYGFLVCVKHGFTNDKLPERVNQMMDLLTYRLKGDVEAIDRDYSQQAQGVAPQLVEAFRMRAQLKFFGHAFEAINYARLHEVVKFTPSQERRIQAGEQAFYDNIVKLRAMDWSLPRQKLGEKFTSDIVIALGHAARALKLMTPQNPDAVA